MGKTDKDVKIVLDFINVYCGENHKNLAKEPLDEFNVTLCKECVDLAVYAEKKRKLCKKDPKPACKNCDTQCYSAKYKDNIRKVMKFSGIYFLKRGRIDYLYHYFR